MTSWLQNVTIGIDFCERMTSLFHRPRYQRLAAAVGGVLLTAALALPAAAAEVTLDCTYVPITGNEFVADTMNGVPAYYNLTGPTYYCAELIPRYFAEVYGLEIHCSEGSLTVLNNDDYYFVKTDNPQPGDVLYGSAAARGKGYSHWAIVKENNGDSLALFEQNWSWNGQAGIDRVLEFPTTAYECYTLVSRSGQEIQPVEGSVAAVSAWAEPYIQQAAEAGIADLKTDFGSTVDRETFCQMAVNILANYGLTAEGDTACEQAAALGLVDTTDGTGAISRQEAAVIASRVLEAAGADLTGNTTALSVYTDVEDIADWAVESVADLTACGLFSGNNGCFNPTDLLTNEQAVALMVRVYDNPTPAVTYNAAGTTACAAESVVAMAAGDMMLSRTLRSAN